MTEANWITGTDPTPMLEYLRGNASDRKLRLFACASCRRIWHLFRHDDSFRSIEVGERFADGEVADEQLRLAKELAIWAGDDASWTSMQEAANAWAAAAPVEENGISAAKSSVYEIQIVFAGNVPKCEEERIAQSHLLRDIFHNPFQPVPDIDPSWLAWKDGAIYRLAHVVYAERAFDRMPELAQALQEAGCDSQELLAHLRGPGPHVRGCWALDLILSKE